MTGPAMLDSMPDYDSDEFAPRDVVVGYDFSDTSDLAVHHALEIANRDGTMVHVIWTDTNLSKYQLTDPALKDAVQQRAASLERRLEQINDQRREAGLKGGDTNIKMHIGRAPDVAQEILTIANAHRAGLIILGGSERSKVGRFLLGSVTEEVTRRAPCSVMITRRLDHQSLGVHDENVSGVGYGEQSRSAES